MLHLSYHGEEHYNSVRLQEDFGSGSPMPISFRNASDLPPVQGDALTTAHTQVKRATGCDNDSLVASALQGTAGNVDEVIL